MGIFSKVRKVVTRAAKDVGVIDRSKKPRNTADPNAVQIDPLTGQPVGTPIGEGAMPQQPMPMQGLGQMPPAYSPQAVSMQQRVPQGLGSNVFRSTLAPLQQQGYGIGQVDPRFLQQIMQQRGGSNAGIGFNRGMFS